MSSDFNPDTFVIHEPTSPPPPPTVSLPTSFRQRSSHDLLSARVILHEPLSPLPSSSFLHESCFLEKSPSASRAPSQPATPLAQSSQPPTQPSTQPSSPFAAEDETFDHFEGEYEMTHHVGHVGTPCNTRAKNTPDQSKWSSREGALDLKDSVLEDHASVIVPVIIPTTDGDNNLHFGILVRPHWKKLFATPEPQCDAPAPIKKYHRRNRSVTFNKTELVVDCGKEVERSRSGQMPTVHVRLLVSVTELESDPHGIHMSCGNPIKAFRDDAFQKMKRRPQAYHSDDPAEQFFRNTFLACKSTTVLCEQSVLPPLRTKNVTVVTTQSERTDIMEKMLIEGWPSHKQINIVWYSDEDRPSSARLE